MISYEKIKLLKDMNKEVHVSCDQKFYNGFIVEINKEKDFIILRDRKVGDLPIMFEEILKIEPVMLEDGR